MTERSVYGSGVVAAGTSSAPSPLHPDFLITHAIWVFSYANIIQIIGGIYVCCLLLQFLGVFKGIRKIYKLIRNRKHG